MARVARRFRPIELGGSVHASICRGIVLAGALALFLHDAATVGVSYTLRLSYGLMACACVLGAPFVLRGWRAMPLGVRLAGGFLMLVYVLAGILGVDPVLAGQGRGSSTRWVVYVLDLGLGMASLGLLFALFDDAARVRGLVLALVAGGLLAAAYGVYQWFAQHYGWPLANVNNAPNSDNFSTGARYQGNGLLGWERVRGTFVEPFAFGIYLAAIIPLACGARPRGARHARTLTAAALALLGAALLLTDSSLSWASLLLAAALVGCGALIGAGRPALAGMAGATAALLSVLCLVTVAEPGLLSSVTARPDSQLHLTVGARTGAWSEASDIWSQHPVLGLGPGASSVKLARRDDAVGVSSAPIVLGSAYGIWAASLIDAGVFGLLAWAVLIGAVLTHVASVALRARSTLLWATLAAALAASLAAQVGGDRLDLRVWMLLAVALAASRTVGPRVGHGARAGALPA